MSFYRNVPKLLGAFAAAVLLACLPGLAAQAMAQPEKA
jgi:hypothetical protein